jgi:uncharacterized MAPEG superfamily protein
MTPDLHLLLWSVALTVVQMIIAAAGANGQVGLATLAGNRDNMPATSGWAGRAARAHANMLESLPLFAALVLIAQVTNHATAMTALGAQLFFWARLVYAIIYLAGIPWLRTAVWAVSMVGLVIIFLQLV